MSLLDTQEEESGRDGRTTMANAFVVRASRPHMLKQQRTQRREDAKERWQSPKGCIEAREAERQANEDQPAAAPGSFQRSTRTSLYD
jgi:hypothetical protein